MPLGIMLRPSAVLLSSVLSTVLVVAACGGDDTETAGAAGAGAGAGGQGAAGGFGTGAGGASPMNGGGGEGGCGDTTSDSNHCGACDNVCLSGVCEQSLCQPAFMGCVDAAPGDTCDSICAGLGGTCVAQDCDGIDQGLTFRTFDLEDSCLAGVSTGGEFTEACSAVVLDFAVGDWTECCCR
jgi:hypothetical protein